MGIITEMANNPPKSNPPKSNICAPYLLPDGNSLNSDNKANRKNILMQLKIIDMTRA